MNIRSSLIIVAHGSRREASNEEIRQLTKRLAATLDHFDQVSCGFLELADPDIPTAVEQDIERGASMVTILPYFLSAGRHINEDIPSILEALRGRHQNTEIRQLPYVGELDGMLDLLLSALGEPSEAAI